MSKSGDSPAPASDPVTGYARDVVAGRYVVGRLVRLACERHLRDLDGGRARGLWFDEVEAAAAIEFWELCPHVKSGITTRAGDPIRLEPWQRFIVGSVYGWKRADGTRRFRVAWCEMARKQGKTTLAYPAALHALMVDGEEGGEVYSVATKRDQAKLVFEIAQRAVRLTPDLAALVTNYKRSIVDEHSFSKFEPLSADADTLDGLNPSCVIADEIHAWKGRGLWDVIETGMGARRQPLLWAITTAGEEGEEDVYGQEHNYTVQVLEGVVEDDGRFGFVACLDPEDDWTDPKNIIKANPNLGVSVMFGDVWDKIKKAVASPGAALKVKRLNLGIRTQDADAWLPLMVWDACRAEVDWSRYAGAPCGAGLDLASSCDFAALALCFPVDEDLTPARDLSRPWGYLFRWRLWIPEGYQGATEKKLRDLCRPWVPKWVTFTDGDVIDHDAIEMAVKADAKTYDVRRLCYDPFNATQLAVRLAADNVPAMQFRQGLTTFAAPTKLFEEAVLGKRLRHDGNPCSRWMANNVVVTSDPAGHKMPARKRSKNKIDGIVAAVMAMAAATDKEAMRSGKSWYDDPKNQLEFI